MKHLILSILLPALLPACSHTSGDKPEISVSIPVTAYFAQRLAGNALTINIMVPQSAGHSDYSPKPGQMLSLAHSKAYLAIGHLDFELVWRERMQAAAPSMQWIDLDRGTHKISGHCCAEHADNEGIDPHYWLSPREALTMVENMANALIELLPEHRDYIATSLDSLHDELKQYDRQLDSITRLRTDTLSFMIYHPALTYIAEAYGMRQYSIEKDGNAPSPQSYMADLKAAQRDSVRVVFVQQGYDIDKARSAADIIGATVVEFAPEGYDYAATMSLIINALQQCR